MSVSKEKMEHGELDFIILILWEKEEKLKREVLKRKVKPKNMKGNFLEKLNIMLI